MNEYLKIIYLVSLLGTVVAVGWLHWNTQSGPAKDQSLVWGGVCLVVSLIPVVNTLLFLRILYVEVKDLIVTTRSNH